MTLLARSLGTLQNSRQDLSSKGEFFYTIKPICKRFT